MRKVKFEQDGITFQSLAPFKNKISNRVPLARFVNDSVVALVI
jgi:hypothetical protein